METRAGDDAEPPRGAGDDPLTTLLRAVRGGVDAVHERPAIVGVTGGVGVGKSVLAATVADSLTTDEISPGVRPLTAAVVSTDGFLRTNAELSELGLLDLKGIPPTYDQPALFDFVRRIVAGSFPLEVPIYSHVRYDRLHDEVEVLDRVDVVILEGLTVLQRVEVEPNGPPASLADLIDVAIYIDANEEDTLEWWLQRFLRMRDEMAHDPESFLHEYAGISEAEARTMGDWVWDNINGPNLRDNIAPSKAAADLVVTKGSDHSIIRVEQVRGPGSETT